MVQFLAMRLWLGLAAAGEDGVTLSAGAGYVWMDPDENLDDTWTLVPRLGYTLNRRWTLETDVGFVQGYTRGFGYGYDALTPRVNVVMNLATEGPVQPFLAGGGGVMWKKVRRDPNASAEQSIDGSNLGNFKNPDSDFLLNGGPGIHIVLGGPMSLRADVRGLLNLGTEPYGEVSDDFTDLEIVLSLCYRDAERRRDTDGDAIVDRFDECVEEPEDRDRYKDEDGCPDRDNDRDRIPDDEDDCPDGPEDLDHFQDDDGCPEEDNDKDGLLDEEDQCPKTPEDRDGIEDEDGCPDDDNDGDGLVDLEDACPNRAEDADGFEDEDGCPEDDNDGDRILDIKDACPLAAEVYNEVNDEDGCPDELPPPPPPEIERFTGVIRGINFKVNSDQITVDSYALLDEAAAVFIKYPSLRIEVAGHTDSDGAAEKNLDLSARRAKAVVTYLIRRGVPPDRLEWVGFGESAPLVDNKSPDGKAVNRRVEFHVLQN
jgi:OOP family OmpA-OmpF porin